MTYHVVPDGAGKYMVTMRDRWGAWRISQGGLDWRHARTVAKAAQADGHRGRLLHADGYARTFNATGEPGGLAISPLISVPWLPPKQRKAAQRANRARRAAELNRPSGAPWLKRVAEGGLE